MKYIFTYVFSYIFECRYGDGLLARPSYRLEPQVLLCSSWAPSPRGATSSSTRGGDLYTPRLVWPVCNEILLFMTYVFAGIPLFRHFLFFCRLREAGLLTLSRLVEVGPIQLDRSLLTALVDRWRPDILPTMMTTTRSNSSK